MTFLISLDLPLVGLHAVHTVYEQRRKNTPRPHKLVKIKQQISPQVCI